MLRYNPYTVYAFILGRFAAADVVMPSDFVMKNNALIVSAIRLRYPGMANNEGASAIGTLTEEQLSEVKDAVKDSVTILDLNYWKEKGKKIIDGRLASYLGVDCFYIRRLKEHGVEVYFEEQNIDTLDGKGELLLTIMSSIAQEESRNISENVTWGIRKRFAEGRVTMPYGQFMGYRRGADGSPEIVEAEARIVRTIFRRFLEGATPAIVARELNNAEIPCPSRNGCSARIQSKPRGPERKRRAGVHPPWRAS